MLDAPGISRELLYKNLRELDWLNRVLGGHSASLKGIKKLCFDKSRTWHIVDLGCGSGDALVHIAKWARRNHIKVKLTGVDRNSDVIQYFNNHIINYPEIVGVVSDYKDFLDLEESIDVVHCSLFCHHLREDDLVNLFRTIKKSVAAGFIINDLHRSSLAYYGVCFLTRLLNASVLSKNDGPISVLRGFKKKELLQMLEKVHFKEYTIHWRWAFRYLVIGKI